MGEDNRRKHTRIEVSFQVELYTDKGNHLVAKVRDLSFGGAYLNYSIPRYGKLEVDSSCTCKLFVEGPDVNPIVVKARVIRANGNGAGLEFIETSPNDFDRFKDYILAQVDVPQALLDELNRTAVTHAGSSA